MITEKDPSLAMDGAPSVIVLDNKVCQHIVKYPHKYKFTNIYVYSIRSVKNIKKEIYLLLEKILYYHRLIIRWIYLSCIIVLLIL